MAVKGKNGYTDAPEAVGKALKAAVRIPDTLPTPEELVAQDQQPVKITLTVNRRSLEKFKRYARQHHGKYQVMLRRLIDSYAENHLGK